MVFLSRFRSRFSLIALALFLSSGAKVFILAQDNVPPSQDTTSGSFSNYQNTPVNSILDIYEQLSGMHLIRDVNLASVPPISINATGVNKAEMLKLIEANLLLNNVALVPQDDRTVKVILIGNNKNPRSEGVKLYANAADLPTDDEIVSYYMPLSYITPTEAQNIFTNTSPAHTYGAYVPAPSAQAIILTDSTSDIRQLIALKELIDVPPARVVSEFIPLTRADAEKVADLLNKMLGQASGGAGGAPAAAPGTAATVPPGVGNDSPLSNEHNLISGTAQIIPETRSNRLLIVTRPVNMPFLKQLVEQLDQPDAFTVPQRYPLRYVLAQDILPALEAALAQGKEEEDEIKKGSTASASTPTSQPANATPQAGNPEAGGGGGGQGLSAITGALSAPAENNVPTVVTVGKTRLLADNRSNSIIVFGSGDAILRISNMIDQLDRKPLQVYLATVIGELTVSEGEEFGIDILQKFQRIGSGGGARKFPDHSRLRHGDRRFGQQRHGNDCHFIGCAGTW